MSGMGIYHKVWPANSGWLDLCTSKLGRSLGAGKMGEKRKGECNGVEEGGTKWKLGQRGEWIEARKGTV